MSDPARTRTVRTAEEIDRSLGEVNVSGKPEWERVGDRLRMQATFADFSAAFAFMTRVAMIAEQLDHHPDWSNVWNKVTIEITTHDRGGVTDWDVEFARRVTALFL